MYHKVSPVCLPEVIVMLAPGMVLEAVIVNELSITILFPFVVNLLLVSPAIIVDTVAVVAESRKNGKP